jgi:AraC-like DNA-binding protein
MRAVNTVETVRAVAKLKTQLIEPVDLSWLSEVRESRHPLSEQWPIWVRHGVIRTGPTLAYPERHPYCEIGTILTGSALQMVKCEEVRRLPGDLFLAGPGLAHWSKGDEYPIKYVTVYFLPIVLVEMGPTSDGAKLLRRFTMRQNLSTLLIRPSRKLRQRFTAGFQEMVKEFDGRRVGREIRLRTILVEMLVALLRWEEDAGEGLRQTDPFTDWGPLDKAFRFLHQHFSGPIYAREVAAAMGVSETRLRVLFQEALGIPWSRYLQIYRIHRSLSYLSQSNPSILDASLRVGFSSISHFNATFRSVMGFPPRVYAKNVAKRETARLSRNTGQPVSATT